MAAQQLTGAERKEEPVYAGFLGLEHLMSDAVELLLVQVPRPCGQC